MTDNIVIYFLLQKFYYYDIVLKEDMARNQMTTEMAEDRKHWHVMSQADTLRSVEADRREGEKFYFITFLLLQFSICMM